MLSCDDDKFNHFELTYGVIFIYNVIYKVYIFSVNVKNIINLN